MSDFHLLRPEWLLALIPAAAVLIILWRSASQTGARDWSGTVDAHLLRHLTVSGQSARPRRGLIAALAAGLLASILAMAGPTWQKLPTPMMQGGTPTVVALSLSQSMNGTDLVPSRLARAGHKLRDILDRAEGADTGLVIYADRPFVAAPLTPDGAVIGEMLPELSTSLMPVLGNRLDLAIAELQDLLASAGARRGTILVMADDLGADPAASLAAAKAARKAGYEVDVLGVGTPEGAALQTADGRAIQVGGTGRTAKLDGAAMQGLAEAGGGRYSTVTADSADLDLLLPAQTGMAEGARASALKTDRWSDKGYLLVLIPILLMPLAFRRGLIFALALAAFGLGLGAPSGPVAAEGLADLWATPDQQGARAFESGDFGAAAQQFASADWRASALYRAGDYAGAAGIYGESGYNAGNALAKAGQLKEALAAYDAELAAHPEDADTKFNRDLVADLLKQQEEQQKQQQDQQSSGGGQDQQDQQQTGESGQDQQQPQAGQTGESQPQEQQSAQNGQDQAEADGQQDAEPQQQAQQGGQSEPQAGDQQQVAASQDQREGSGEGDTPQDQQEQAQQGQQPAPQQTQQGAAQQQTQADAAEQPQNRAGQQRADATSAEPQDDKGALSGLIDRLMQGNGEADDTEKPAQAQASAGAPLDQAGEQQLRAVPDDPAGLLRARIRMHYAQIRARDQ